MLEARLYSKEISERMSHIVKLNRLDTKGASLFITVVSDKSKFSRNYKIFYFAFMSSIAELCRKVYLHQTKTVTVDHNFFFFTSFQPTRMALR